MFFIGRPLKTGDESQEKSVPFKEASHTQEDNGILDGIKVKLETFTKTFGLHIFQNKAYLAVCLNNVLVTFGLSIIYVHLGSYGESIGLTYSEAILLFSVLGASNFLGRISAGLIAQLPCLSCMSIYTGGFFFSAFAVAFIPSFQSLTALALCTGCFGTFTGCFGPCLAQVSTNNIYNRIFSYYSFI